MTSPCSGCANVYPRKRTSPRVQEGSTQHTAPHTSPAPQCSITPPSSSQSASSLSMYHVSSWGCHSLRPVSAQAITSKQNTKDGYGTGSIAEAEAKRGRREGGKKRFRTRGKEEDADVRRGGKKEEQKEREEKGEQGGRRRGRGLGERGVESEEIRCWRRELEDGRKAKEAEPC
eukprot:3016568-Rhodomonas_salina.1